MSTPTNEQRESALRERLAGAESVIRDGGRIHGFALLEIFAEATWALFRIEELAKERDAANAILEELETLTGFTQAALVDEWLCVSKDAARLDWLEAHGLPDEKENDGSTLREAIDAAMSAASSSGANTP